jgi:hypothetical protein
VSRLMLREFFRAPMRSQAIEKPVCVVAFRNDFEPLLPRVFHCERN